MKPLSTAGTKGYKTRVDRGTSNTLNTSPSGKPTAKESPAPKTPNKGGAPAPKTPGRPTPKSKL